MAGRQTDRQFAIRDLVAAKHTARRRSHAHVDLTTYYNTRAQALEAAFRVNTEPTDTRWLDQLLEEIEQQLDQVGSPFDNYLEASESIGRMYHRHGDAVGSAAYALREELMNLAASLIEELWDIDREHTVTADEVRAHGWDPNARAPDPTDY